MSRITSSRVETAPYRSGVVVSSGTRSSGRILAWVGCGVSDRGQRRIDPVVASRRVPPCPWICAASVHCGVVSQVVIGGDGAGVITALAEG